MCLYNLHNLDYLQLVMEDVGETVRKSFTFMVTNFSFRNYSCFSPSVYNFFSNICPLPQNCRCQERGMKKVTKWGFRPMRLHWMYFENMCIFGWGLIIQYEINFGQAIYGNSLNKQVLIFSVMDVLSKTSIEKKR